MRPVLHARPGSSGVTLPSGVVALPGVGVALAGVLAGDRGIVRRRSRFGVEQASGARLGGRVLDVALALVGEGRVAGVLAVVTAAGLHRLDYTGMAPRPFTRET